MQSSRKDLRDLRGLRVLRDSRVLRGETLLNFAASLMLAVVLGAGCAAPGQATIEPPALAGCRTAVAPGGDPSTDQIRWVRPETAGDRAKLDDWCRSVGPAVVVSSPAEPEPDVDSSGLVVISWNINVGAGDVAALVTSLRNGTLTGQPVNRFVLLLQEAFRASELVPNGQLQDAESAGAIRPRVTGRDRIDIVSVAANLGLALYYVPSMRNGAPDRTNEDRGNAILSTEPLSDLAAIELPFERQRRVAIEAAVASQGSMLRLTNVHLDNRAPARRLWLFAIATRLRQARGLLRDMTPTGPAVLGGDFNTWYGFHDPVFAEVAESLAPAATVDRRPTFGVMRLDHLFFRLPDGWRASTTRLDVFGSDHHPLMATIGPER
jgi:endonuclease/exonuclease/phosphatase family metal-dependent hydrolase